MKKHEKLVIDSKIFCNIIKSKSGIALFKNIFKELVKTDIQDIKVLETNKDLVDYLVSFSVKYGDKISIFNVTNANNLLIKNAVIFDTFRYIDNDLVCNEKINYYNILYLNNNCNDNFDTLISEYFIQSNNNEKYIENFKITEFNLKKILKEINQKHSDNIIYIYLSMFIANKEERMQILKKYYDEVLDDFNDMLLELL